MNTTFMTKFAEDVARSVDTKIKRLDPSLGVFDLPEIDNMSSKANNYALAQKARELKLEQPIIPTKPVVPTAGSLIRKAVIPAGIAGAAGTYIASNLGFLDALLKSLT